MKYIEDNIEELANNNIWYCYGGVNVDEVINCIKDNEITLIKATKGILIKEYNNLFNCLKSMNICKVELVDYDDTNEEYVLCYTNVWLKKIFNIKN